MTLPRFGYHVIQRKKEIDRDRASEYLTPKRQKKITKAVLGEQTVTVEKTVIHCPRCGGDTPDYVDFLDGTETDEPFQSISKWRIAEWADRQLQLFHRIPKELYFREPALSPKRFICPICRMASRESEGAACVRIRNERNKISVSLALEIEDLFFLSWTPSLRIGNEELYETVTFHLKKHRIYLSVEGASGTRYAVWDISKQLTLKIVDEPVLKAIRLYKPAIRRLKRFFAEKNGWMLPIFDDHWSLYCCFLMTELFGKTDIYPQESVCGSEICNCERNLS